MANIKSQIKRIKTNEKAYLRNKSVSSSIKTAVRKFREAVVKGDAAANQKSSMAKAAAKAGVREFIANLLKITQR